MSKLEKISIALLALFGVIVFVHDRYLASKLDNQPIQIVQGKPISTIAKPTTTYKDSSGRNHVVINSNANTIKAAKNVINSTLGSLDTVALALKLAEKDRDKITQITQANLQLQQENLILKAQRDTLKKKTIYNYKDKYLTLTGSKPDSSNNITLGYTFNTDLNWVDYSKRAWFLATKKSYTDIFSDNPNITIRGINRVTIEHPVSEFGLRLKASTDYSFYSKLFGIGPGVEISLSRFDIFGYNYYYPYNNQWHPTIRVDYNLVSF